MKRKALVVGINRYPFLGENGEPRNLTTAVSDAEAIARVLELYGGFEVKRLPSGPYEDHQFDPTGLVKADNLKQALKELFTLTEGSTDTTALFFFAGNGLRKGHDNGETEGFVATTDSAPHKDKYGVSLKWLRELLQTSTVKEQIVWLDSSFSGEFLNFPETDEDKTKSRCFIVATKADQYAYAADRKGLLTKEIINLISPENNHQKNSLFSHGIVLTNHTLKKFIPSELNTQGATQNPIIYNQGEPIIITLTLMSSKAPDWIFSKEQHRLEKLWFETDGWFASHHPLMFHTFSSINNEQKCQEAIENVLGFPVPDNWWCENFYESLKSLCGDCFSGCKATGDRHISVGSAYLLALMAHQAHYQTVETMIKDVTWNNLTKAPKSWLFSHQDYETARSSAKALYDLFFILFESIEKNKKSPVKKLSINQPGNRLLINLDWSASVSKKDDSQETLANWTNSFLNAENISIPAQMSNTRSAIKRLWRNMLISKNGFLSPGVVYMQEEKLVIASYE